MEPSRTQDREETSSQRRPDAGPDAGDSAVGTTGRWTGGSTVKTTGRWTGGSVVRKTGRWTGGSTVGTTGRGRRNRPDVGKQRPIEYSKVPERQICDRTRPVAGNRTLASVRSAYCRLNGRDDRTRPVRTIQRPVSSSFTGFRPQRLLLNGAYKYNLQPAN